MVPGPDAGQELVLEVAGLGIILYSPAHALHIREGENYLRANYLDGPQVQRHLQAGTIVGFGTDSPGTFVLNLRTGYPDEAARGWANMMLRLGVHVAGGRLCFRDLYDLMEWSAEAPEAQTVELADGYYHVTLCSRVPDSGILGDRQVILVYLQPLDRMPDLAKTGIPTLARI